ncbi:MAG: BON domain-containing protein [Actinomycetota bacterium]
MVGRIQRALATDTRTGELELDARIAGGRVFLTGAVATPERREAVERVVREVAPDLEVHNELSVTEEQGPGPAERVS